MRGSPQSRAINPLLTQNQLETCARSRSATNLAPRATPSIHSHCASPARIPFETDWPPIRLLMHDAGARSPTQYGATNHRSQVANTAATEPKASSAVARTVAVRCRLRKPRPTITAVSARSASRNTNRVSTPRVERLLAIDPQPQVGLLDGAVGHELGRRAGPGDPPRLQNI